MASNSSRLRPEPTATHVSGDSARCTGICVSWRSRSSRFVRSAPPPARTMPRSMMSAASSGGVLSSVDRCGHRLFDEIRLTRAGAERRFLDGALLDTCHARRNADDDARMCEAMLMDLLDEVPKHLLGHVEVGDDAVLQRPDRSDRP